MGLRPGHTNHRETVTLREITFKVNDWDEVSKASQLGLVGFAQAHGNPELGEKIDSYQFGR